MAPVKRKRLANNTPIKISVAPPPPQQLNNVALPPPLVPYHPHLVPSYYPVYHQHPYFLQVGPQPPISPSLSPTLPSSPVNNNDSTTTTTTTTTNSQRILPKSPTPNHPTLAPTFNYFPYPVHVSPQLHPTATATTTTTTNNNNNNNNNGSPSQVHLQPHPGSISPMPFQPTTPVRHNSTSSITTTADQREHARKVSHSAIERRRRERINDKIIQLKELIPTCANQENLHKMTILQSAIEYITYLKKLVEEKDTNKSAATEQEDKSRIDIPPEVIVVNEDKDEDNWSVSSSPKPTHIGPVTPLPTMGLKPMDLINLNKRSSTPPPRIVIHEHTSDGSTSSIDRNMNLENILC